MRKTITIILAIAALASLAVTVGVVVHRHNSVSEVYKQYSGRPDLKVGFVKDYRIDDTTVADVTTLTAKDSASWEALMIEMKIDDVQKETMRKALSKGQGFVISHYCEKGHPETVCGPDIPNYDLVIISPVDCEFYIFDITSEAQACKIANSKRMEIVHKKQKQLK